EPTTALDHFLVGETRFRLSLWDAAAKQFNQVLRLEPGHFWARYYLALCSLKLNRPGEARDLLTALLVEREFPWVYLLRGFANSHLLLRDYAAAENDFKLAMERGKGQ